MRPTGLTDRPTENRYQYQVSGSSPVASTCTECARAGSATTSPEATTSSNASPAAISHRTGRGWSGSPPPTNSGSFTSRVHRMTASGSGSPDATPRANSSAGRLAGRGGMSAAVSGGVSPTTPVGTSPSLSSPLHPAASAVATMPARNVRRPITVTR